MNKIRERLEDLAHALGLTDTLLARAQRRWQKWHAKAVDQHHKGLKAQREADRLRTQGHIKAAEAATKRADRCHHRAYQAHLRAEWWVARVKALTLRKEGIVHTTAELEEELAKLKREHGVQIDGNKVTGGTPRQRLRACMLASAAACARGKRANFYSQAGAWDIEHCITGPAYGNRDDCSSWFTSVYHSCGLPDPNGENYGGGYTGTLGANGKRVAEANLEPGDAVLFGTEPFHHVEMYCGPGNRTIGHGSAPVDPGTTTLLPGPRAFRSFV